MLEVVWSVSDYSALVTLLPTLRPPLAPRCSPQEMLALHLRVHYTRAPRANAPPPPPPADMLPAGVTLMSGHLNYGWVSEETCDAVVAASGSPSDVGMTHCGLQQLGEQIYDAVKGLSWERWMGVQNVEVHSECLHFPFYLILQVDWQRRS